MAICRWCTKNVGEIDVDNVDEDGYDDDADCRCREHGVEDVGDVKDVGDVDDEC